MKAHRAKRLNYKTLQFPKSTRKFYKSFRKFIIRELRSQKVRDFVWVIIEEQGIDPSKVESVNVAPHPFGASKGEVTYANRKKRDLSETHYVGFYYPDFKRIDIYPPRLPLVATEKMKAKQIWDNHDLHYYFFSFEPVSILIHEYLHTKYRGERTVEKLTRRYMADYEKETTGKIVYSNKKIPYFIWLGFFLELYQDHLF